MFPGRDHMDQIPAPTQFFPAAEMPNDEIDALKTSIKELEQKVEMGKVMHWALPGPSGQTHLLRPGRPSRPRPSQCRCRPLRNQAQYGETATLQMPSHYNPRTIPPK